MIEEIPKDIVPLDKLKKKYPRDLGKCICTFYIRYCFRRILSDVDKYIDQFKKYAGVISPDFLYISICLCVYKWQMFI